MLDYDSVEAAYKCALEKAEEDDLVIIFGSFFTVTKVLEMGLLTPNEKV